MEKAAAGSQCVPGTAAFHLPRPTPSNRVARTILGAKWSELATIMPSDFLASMSERLRAIYSARLEEHRQGEAQPTRWAESCHFAPRCGSGSAAK